MKRFQNMTNSFEIASAIALAEHLLKEGSKMMVEIGKKNDFKYNSGNGLEVMVNLIKSRQVINVYTYRPWNPWTKAIGYFDGKAIHVNSRTLPFTSTVSIAANLIHEYSHYCGYRHGNNYKTQEKCLYSVPYFISSNIQRWI